MCKQGEVKIIAVDMGDDDFTCEVETEKGVCGNTDVGGGFSNCDEEGNEMEPLEGLWNGHYRCCDCGQIYLSVSAEEEEESNEEPKENSGREKSPIEVMAEQMGAMTIDELRTYLNGLDRMHDNFRIVVDMENDMRPLKKEEICLSDENHVALI
ncbi:hypothetical protein [Bacillus sp. NEAU-Y102]